MSDERAEALRRHPSCQGYRPAVEVLTARLAGELAAAGARFPEIAAAVIARRASTGLGPVEFAAACGLSAADVQRLELDGCLEGQGLA